MKWTLPIVCAASLLTQVQAQAGTDPAYSDRNHLNLPADYREWVFLSSGLNMSYRDVAPGTAHGSVFTNVYVNPEAYHAFQRTGAWPDKTTLALEIRFGSSKGSINKSGQFQTGLEGIEFHVKDEAQFPGKWAFFKSDGKAPAEKVADGADCYSCHQQHAALDTTFIQFYPTLLEIAKAKGTLDPAYLKAEDGTGKLPPLRQQ